MELLNDRVYPARDIEQWLSESADVARGTRAWKSVLKDAEPVSFVVGEDSYFFERVSDTHFRVHRANAKAIQEIHDILNVAGLHRQRRLLGLLLKLLVPAAAVIFAAGWVADMVRYH
jgi:hypothetical protein